MGLFMAPSDRKPLNPIPPPSPPFFSSNSVTAPEIRIWDFPSFPIAAAEPLPVRPLAPRSCSAMIASRSCLSRTVNFPVLTRDVHIISCIPHPICHCPDQPDLFSNSETAIVFFGPAEAGEIEISIIAAEKTATRDPAITNFFIILSPHY